MKARWIIGMVGASLCLGACSSSAAVSSSNESADHRYSGVPRSLGAFEYPGREGRGVLYGLKVHKLRVLDITVRKGNGPSGNQPE